MDIEETNIQEAIGQFYSFFGRMGQVKGEIDQLNLDMHTKDRILTQLDDIEREYKYGQEWFMTRDVQDVRVGVVGSERSLKTAVVSLFVEGVMEIEGDEKDGRSKSKINVEGKCKLLLIREETGAPTKQMCQWADVLLLVFSYSDEDSLLHIRDYHKIFRDTNQHAPVMLVGVKDEDQYSFRRTVREGDVRKTSEVLEKCYEMDVGLSQQSTYALFAQACKLALSTSANSYPLKFVPPSSVQCPNSYYAAGSGISLGLVAAGVQKFGGNPPVSPSHMKRNKQRRSMFGGKQAAYAVSESFGSGRPVPVKEGFVNKKSTGGLRAEWKRKYLELSQDELSYYPNLNDYMTKTHGKTLKLQQITVKVPGQRVSSVSKVTSTPTESIASDLADSLTVSLQPGDQSDHSRSNSPVQSETPLDVSYNSSHGRPGLRLTAPSFEYNSRDHRNHLTPEHEEFSSTEQFDEMGVYNPTTNHRSESHMTNGRGHNRNGSLDENVIMLQQLRTGGISYPPIEEDRSATMPRLDGRKAKLRQSPHLSALPGSEEHLSGSQDSLGRPEKGDRKKKGDKDRNSFIMERTQSEGAKDRVAVDKKGVKGHNHKRQRSWGGNKLLEVDTGGDVVNDSCEFHVFSADNKVWCFEAASSEEATSWVKAIGEQIKKTISESVSHKRGNSSNEIEKKEILLTDGNNFCTDCNSPNPEWASLNHGCVLCIECSGVHRNLGTHISRIRSLELDDWSPELISVMLHIGNKMSRSLWEAKRPKNRPTYSTPREERERFIKAKYIDKEYLADLPYTGKPIYEQLMEAVKSNNIFNCLNILAHTMPEDINTIHTRDSWAALHVACVLGRTVITQLLIWNGGDINIADADKHTPLFYARNYGHQDIVNILLANSCTEDTSDTSV